MSRSIAYRFVDGDVERIEWALDAEEAARRVAWLLELDVSYVRARLERVGPYLSKTAPPAPARRKEPA